MLRTKTIPEKQSPKITLPPEIQKIVDERGFYLYEWISIEELRLTMECDYLYSIRKTSKWLFILMIIVAILGFIIGNILGILYSTVGLLAIFYLGVFVNILYNFLRRSYLYVQGSNVVMTDEYIIFGKNIIPRLDVGHIKKIFLEYEYAFQEKFLGESNLKVGKIQEQKKLFDTFKEIISDGKKMMQSMMDIRSVVILVPVIALVGLLYSIFMVLMYCIGLPIIYILGRVFFSGIAYVLLRVSYCTEYRIQSCFNAVYTSSLSIKDEKTKLLLLLGEARENEWKDNLLGKIQDVFPGLRMELERVMSTTEKLSLLVNQSEYRGIFNFQKYTNWTHNQILEPLDSIFLLLAENCLLLQQSVRNMDEQIKETTDTALQPILQIQRNRLLMQVESFNQNIQLLSSYRDRF